MRKPLKKTLEFLAVLVVGIALLLSGVWLGWTAGRNVPKNIVVTGVTEIQTPSSTDADFGTFWQAWSLINDNYLRNDSTTNQEKVYGAITGLVNSLGDPYTEFFPPADNQQFQQDITGDFGGIGAQLGTNDNGDLVVVAPLKGTPAESAGLKPEDIIEAINGTSTVGVTVDDAVNLIRGSIGTPVTLSILRAGWTAPKDFKIIRENIVVPDVEFAMKGNVAVITLSEFTQDADQDFYNALAKAVTMNAQGIVIDLRDDPGGYLEVAVDLSGYFLKPGTLVVKEVGRTVPEEDFKSTGDGALSTMPMAILVNSGSASAAEILAGALHDDRNIPLVGEKSFGKGTVQELEPLADGSAIKMTIAHWVLPSGRILDHDGLVPEYPVADPTDAQVAQGVDPQMDKAIAVVQGEISGHPVPMPPAATSTATTTTTAQ